jgi:sterol desaturase/sphingolipid hydroxylase (fatty acid hydroxylase superfamily)
MIAFAFGLFTWTFLEYVLHRFVFHDRRLGVAMAREHLEHHAKVDWFAPFSSKVRLAVVVLSGLALVAVPLFGWTRGLAYVFGIVGGWMAYEVLHRSIHVRPPKNAYGRWAWRHHLHHHFGDPRRNHGVSSPLWDVVFRTYTPVSQVIVPPRSAKKLPWLLDGDAIAAGLADTYVLGARRSAAG